IYGKEIQKVRQMIEAEEFITGTGSSAKEEGMIPRYIDFVKDKVRLAKPVRAVMDCGNGAAALVAPELIRALGCEITELFCTPDGHFPNHHPDPTVPANIKDLIRTVRSENTQAGIAYDGDADRLGVVDEKGNILWGDQLLIIFSRDVLKRLPKST